jgi:type II secretory pathway pseudopilin PulG
MDREAPRTSNGTATGGPVRAAVRHSPESGYAMAALLVGMSVMAVFMSAALPVWSTSAKRLKEDELVFRGEQYAHAIALYQRKYANQLPPSIDVLINERFLRRKYLDPITGQEFQVLTGAVGQAAPGMGAGGRGSPVPGRQGGTTTPGNTGRSLNGMAGATGGFGPGRSTSASGPTGFQGGTTGFQGSGTTGRGTGIGGTTGIGAGSGIGAGDRGTAGSPFGGAGGAGGIVGVASKSKEKSLRVYNGRDVYNEWTFVPVQRVLQAGGEGQTAPGLGGGRGQATPGQPNQGSRGTGGSRGFGSGSDAFRPNPTGPGASGGFRPGGSTNPFGR